MDESVIWHKMALILEVVRKKRVTFKKMKESYQGTPYYQLYFNKKKLFKILLHKAENGYFYLVDYGKTSFSAGADSEEEMQMKLDGMIERAVKEIEKRGEN